MAWSYDPQLSEDKDKVRRLIGDVYSAEQLVQDGEIEFFITQEGSLYRAAAACCDAIAASFARQVDRTIGTDAEGDQRQGAIDKRAESHRHAHYMRLAAQLRREAAKRTAGWAGGISVLEKEEAEQDSDRVMPAFERDTHFDSMHSQDGEDDEA